MRCISGGSGGIVLLLLQHPGTKSGQEGHIDQSHHARKDPAMSEVKGVVYIKADQNVEVSGQDVRLKDILSMECTKPEVLTRLKTLKLLKIPDEGKHRYVVSVMRIIERIHQEYPNLDIQNIGSPDVMITYEGKKKASPVATWFKVVAISLIVFFGGAYSIMSFNNDTNAPQLFAQIYRLFLGREQDGFGVLEATYCIGLALGILIFFNHFGKSRIAVDPTPLEVEMRLYENDIQTTLIQTYSRKGMEDDVD